MDKPRIIGGGTKEEQILYYENMAQIFLITAMRLSGVLPEHESSALIRFSTRYAPLIRNILDGIMYVPEENEFQLTRNKVKERIIEKLKELNDE